MSDQLTLDLSQQPEYAVPFVRNSEWLWCLDTSPSGNYYSGTSILDTSSLSNSNKWLNWQSAYLAIPQRIRCIGGTLASAANTTLTDYMAGIKSGFLNSINSCQVEINGVTVQQSTQLSNLVWNYRLLTNMSYNDLIKYGSTLGFYPDDSNSWTYNNANSDDGPAGTFSNNQDGGTPAITAALAGTTAATINRAFLQRQNWLSYSTTLPATPTPHTYVSSATNLNLIFKSYVETVAGVNAGNLASKTYNMMAVVRLRDICPLFAQLGLCKGLLVRLTMTLNQPSFSVSYDTTHEISAVSNSFPYGGQTNPVMLASATAGCGGLNVADSGAVPVPVTVDLRIGKTLYSNGNDNQGPFGQGNIKLWVQSCILSPEQEAELIAKPIRKFKYNDLYETDFTVVAGGTANQLLFNGVPRCRRLILMPMAVGGVAGYVDGQGGGCTMPMAGLNNMQIYLSGMPLFPTPIEYDYRFYMEQFTKSGLNYGMVEGLSSGLIGQDQWENNYRYYVVDLHQGLESDDDVTKNVQISFTSQTQLDMRLYCFIEYERQLELNILSSAVVSFK